ncbi:DNA-directed RNA polymerase III subunit rpc5 [Lecanosticta acicola]|uniref:DNA-directed RNA polymerase III subunit rpc5 n=1 Tax=Lecanosticta acicola TaxID=111012 RepID=A0AAI9ECK1_9PEZI|nr:DNA-directed RNA polymerase III subunit rpc5 [Lecanosticta acicola]
MPTAVRAEDDPVTAEYDVFLTPPIEEQVYILQYPNRSRSIPYNRSGGAMPQDMRIKPQAGFMEMDVDMNSKHNFNKYMALKWADAKQSSKELHNPSVTYGPASGLVGARPGARSRSALKGQGDRELELENDLMNFEDAEKNERVFNKQTLGGQIIRHNSEAELGKPYYFVGAFQGNQLHLTKVHGTVQMRPHFHHLDAEEERARVTASRAQAEAAGPGPDPVAKTVSKTVKDKEDKDSTEAKLKKFLENAKLEPWLKMEYMDEDLDIAYHEFQSKLKVMDPSNLPHLKSQMDNDAFLDAISAPRHDGLTRRKKRASRGKETVEIEDEDGEQEGGEVAAPPE